MTKKSSMKKPTKFLTDKEAKALIDEPMTFQEMKALMDEHCDQIPWEGGSPTLASTNYLAEENDENPPQPPTKKRK